MGKLFKMAGLALSCACITCASPLLVNGGFETGNFDGWTVVNQAESFSGSDFFVISGSTTSQSMSTTGGPAGGNFYAVTDQAGPGTHALLQTFTVPAGAASVVLSYSLFVNSYGGTAINPNGLDFTGGASQFARVDILAADASPLDTGAGVLRNFYIGTDSGPNPNAYTNDVFDITSLVGAGGTFQLRFAESDNLDILNLGVDNVDIELATVPEPSSWLQSIAGAVLLLSKVRKRVVARRRN